MNKRYLFLTLIVALIILVGCSNNLISSGEVVELDNIKNPDRLEILSPDLNKKNQELAIKGQDINELSKNRNNLSNEERKVLEEKIDKHIIEANELHTQMIKINNQEVIEDIFSKIRDSKGTYTKYLSDDRLRNSNYYSVQLFYEGIDILTDSLEDGYILSFLIFEDNTLVFFDRVFDGVSEPREIIMRYDYEWFENQVEQEVGK